MSHRVPRYGDHDAVYRRLRADGASGWSSDDEYARMLRLIEPCLPPAGTPQELLELGCGAGNLGLLLAKRGARVTGVDISATAISWAIERAAAAKIPATFVVDNVVDLAHLPAAVFDTVVDGHCLHCIVGADRARCLAAVRRVLRPGGRWVVLTMCGEVRDPDLLRHFDAATSTLSRDGVPIRHIGSAQSIVDEVVRAGFIVQRMQVEPRRSDAEQDDLLILAVAP
jgi:SAM-dependent methyltransferase